MRFKEFLNEVKISSSDIAKIAKMTNDNDHNGARVLGAKLLKNKKYETIFTAISKISDVEKNTPKLISDYRYQVEKEMFKFAKSKLSDEDYNNFHSAY